MFPLCIIIAARVLTAFTFRKQLDWNFDSLDKLYQTRRIFAEDFIKINWKRRSLYCYINEITVLYCNKCSRLDGHVKQIRTPHFLMDLNKSKQFFLSGNFGSDCLSVASRCNYLFRWRSMDESRLLLLPFLSDHFWTSYLTPSIL